MIMMIQKIRVTHVWHAYMFVYDGDDNSDGGDGNDDDPFCSILTSVKMAMDTSLAALLFLGG